MMMFLGRMSSASSGGSFCRRMRLRSATATERLAFGLAHHVLVQLRHNLPRGQFVQRRGILDIFGQVENHV